MTSLTLRRRTSLVTLSVAALAAATLAPLTPASAAPTTGLDLDPIGYNIVDGAQDLENPITDDDLTADQGLTSTEASNGSVPDSRKIIGEDDREQVEDTTGSPHRRVGQIQYFEHGGSYTCTGWLISPDTVATAGHCVPADAQDITFSPGRNGSEKPFGTQNATEVWHDTDSARDHDWAAIKLDEPIGETVGWFGIASNDGQDLTGEDARVIGYPGDKAYATMWQHTGTIGTTTSRQIHYDTDTAGGQSGSAVTDGPGETAYAIHTSGTSQRNVGLRLTGELFNTLVGITER